MKYLVLIICFALLFACDEENPNSASKETKYTIEELENDPDWVEITEIDTVGVACEFNESKMKNKSFIARSNKDIKQLEDDENIRVVISNAETCSNEFKPEIDFENKVLIASEFGFGINNYERRLFKNSKLKEIKYMVLEHINKNETVITIPIYFNEAITINFDSSYSVNCHHLKI